MTPLVVRARVIDLSGRSGSYLAQPGLAFATSMVAQKATSTS